MPTRYAAITRPPVHMSMMVRPVEGRPHPVAAEKFDLPRWLTEDHPPKPRVLVMSEPPHDLVPPPGAVEAHPASAPPRAVIYASPAASNPVTLRAPGYHPFYRAPYGTYYGPYYAPPPAYGDGRSTMAAGTTERAYPQAPTNGW